MRRREDETRRLIKQYIAAKDQVLQMTGEPTLSTLLDSVELPADLTQATRPEYVAIRSGNGTMSEYSLKCLILLGTNRIGLSRCLDLCQHFDAIAGFQPRIRSMRSPPLVAHPLWLGQDSTQKHGCDETEHRRYPKTYRNWR